MPKKLETQTWWSDFLREKDDATLRELAARYGVSVGGLVASMKRLGVDRSAQPPGRKKGDATRPLAENVAEGVTKRRSGAPPLRSAPNPNVRMSKLAAFAELMGTVPDGEVARRAGATRNAVQQYRMRHGIDPFEGDGRPTAGARGAPNATPEGAGEVGSLVSEPRPGAAGQVESVAWRVEFGSGEVRYTVAETASGALGRVTAAALGDVVAVQRIGAALA